MKLSPRQVLLCGLADAASIALAAPAFFIAGTSLLDLRLVVGGLIAWSGLFAFIFLGIGAVVFVIAIPSLYAGRMRKGRLARPFCTVLSIQLFAIPVLHALAKIEHYTTDISALDAIIGIGGVGLGVLFAVLAARAPRRQSALRPMDSSPKAP